MKFSLRFFVVVSIVSISFQNSALSQSWFSDFLYGEDSKECQLTVSEQHYVQDHLFEYRGRLLTPQQLYGSFAREAYNRLKQRGSDYGVLLEQPDIIYRLDQFLEFADKHTQLQRDDVICAFKKSLGKFPSPPHTRQNNRLVGDWPSIAIDLLGFIKQTMYRYGPDIIDLELPFAGLFMYPHMVVVNPEIAQQILSDTSGNIIKGDGSDQIRDQLFSPEGLIWMEANVRWGILNKALFNGPFNPKEFPERYGNLFQENFKWLIKRWKNKEDLFNFHKEITYYTMRVMSYAFFDYVLSDNQLVAVTDAFYTMLDIIHKRFTRTINIPMIIPTSENALYGQAFKVFSQVLNDIIDKAPSNLTIGDKQYDSIIGILKLHKDPDTGKQLSYEEIFSHIATIFFAAHDTTANFITMLIYELYNRPDWKKKIELEMQVKLDGRSKKWIPMGVLPEYTKFKNEVLRLYPSVPFIMVDTACEMVIGGFTIPKKTTLGLAIHSIQRNPLFYKNPDGFNPNRIDPNNEDYTPYTSKSFMSFSFGRRRCLGQWFAQAEARNLVAGLLENNIRIKFFTDEVDMKIACTGVPNRTIWAKIEKDTQDVGISNTHDDYRIQDAQMFVSKIYWQDQAHTIKTIRFAMPNGRTLPAKYYPGDHLNLFSKDENNNTVMRHFSISSSPTDSDEWIEITVKKEISGIMSELIHENFKVGDTVQVRLPLDDGVRISEYDSVDSPLVLISGGIGITPMMSIAQYLCNKKWQGDIYFIHSSKDADHLPFAEQLDRLARQHDNFHLFITMTRDDNWDGLTGRIDKEMIVRLEIPKIHDARVYVCGSTNMCDAVSSILFQECNVQKESIHQLSFGVLNWQCVAKNKITREEVKKHNTVDDAWMIMNGVVYDVTDYLSLHPGLDVIMDYLGDDATHIFNHIPHSAVAKKLLNESDIIKTLGVID